MTVETICTCHCPQPDKAAAFGYGRHLNGCPYKPHLRLHVKLGASSRMPLWTITAPNGVSHDHPLTTWRAHCAQAIEDAARRARLGL